MLKPLSVSQLSYYVTKIFEAEELLQNVKVYGEVSGLKDVRGNLYFNLKDEDSLMPCIMFGASSISFKDGDQILATGSLKYYAKGGKLNFYVTSAILNGSGLLYQKFVELKNKLELEGVFSDKYKKPLPEDVKTIGVITSQTGAVIHDIQTVSHRRNPSLNIIIYPAKVQGIGAESTIINGLKCLDKLPEVDVIIIARGGGSIEDLQPFNTENLAREIIKTNKPVISAVGHETDFTICDFASSLRAATPSVAAELVAKNVYEELNKILNNLQSITRLLFHLLDMKYERLDNSVEKISDKFIHKIKEKNSSFNQIVNKLSMLGDKFVIEKENSLKLLNSRLLLLNPVDILNRGWAKVYNNNKNVESVDNVTINDTLKIELKDGQILTNVVSKIKGGT